MDWHDDSACRTEDPELFFPEGSAAPAKEQTAKAKRICEHCPVIDPCLDLALRTGQHGIWGGLDDHERRILIKRMREAAPWPRRVPLGQGQPQAVPITALAGAASTG